MRITITCEDCGRRHRLERQMTEPGPIWIICHSCETPLRAELEPSQTAPIGEHFAQTWGGIIDVERLTSSGPAA